MGGHIYKFNMTTTTYHPSSKRETLDENSALFSTLLSANRHAYVWHVQSAGGDPGYDDRGVKPPRIVNWKTPYSANFALTDTVSVSIKVVEVPIAGPDLAKSEKDSSLLEWMDDEGLEDTRPIGSDDEGEDRLANPTALNDEVRPTKRKRS